MPEKKHRVTIPASEVGVSLVPDNDSPPSPPKQEKRPLAAYLGMPAHAKLDLACQPIWNHFGNCYLVGSATTTRDWRDVDLRVMLDKDRFVDMFGHDVGETLDEFWNLLCTSISCYLSEVTDLPIDFQIQERETANRKYSGVRVPMGNFLRRPRKPKGFGKEGEA